MGSIRVDQLIAPRAVTTQCSKEARVQQPGSTPDGVDKRLDRSQAPTLTDLWQRLRDTPCCDRKQIAQARNWLASGDSPDSAALSKALLDFEHQLARCSHSADDSEQTD